MVGFAFFISNIIIFDKISFLNHKIFVFLQKFIHGKLELVRKSTSFPVCISVAHTSFYIKIIRFRIGSGGFPTSLRTGRPVCVINLLDTISISLIDSREKLIRNSCTY